MSTRLTTWADKIISDRRTMAERMTVRPVSQYRFYVLGGAIKEGIVDIPRVAILQVMSNIVKSDIF